MELLGSAEEQRLFSADNMVAVMHWPAGYFVDASDWVTESTEAFARPHTPSRRQCLLGSCATGGNSQTHRGLASASLQHAADGVGIFTELLFPNKARRGRLDSALSMPRQAPPATHDSTNSTPFYACQGQQQHTNEQPQCQHQWGAFERSLQERRRITSAGDLARAIRRHRHERNNPLASPHYGHTEVSPEAYGAFRRANSAGIYPDGTSKRLQGASDPQFFLGDVKQPISARSEPHRSRREEAEGLPGEHALQSQPEEGRRLADSSPANSTEYQKVLERHKEVLRHQYEQVEKMRIQLKELEQLLSSLQLQASACQQTPPQPSSHLRGRHLDIRDLEPLECEEEENGGLSWSLDPRDYKQMPVRSMDWIPPAGVPSVRSRVYKAPENK